MHDSHDDDLGHGGAWKVAYADFVTALMALFIVLWLMTASREVRESISGYFKDPRGKADLSGSGLAGSGESLRVARSDIDKLKEKLDIALRQLPGIQNMQQYMKFSMTGEGLRIELMENEGGMFFESGSHAPTQRGEELFRTLANELSRMPNQIAIEGHTDAQPFHAAGASAYSNWDLSFDRANEARRVMERFGLRSAQVTEIRGYADRRTLVDTDPLDSRNRRISIIMKYQ